MRRNNRIAVLATSLITLLAIVVFVILGLTLSAWHPGWIVFLLIPITRTIASMFSGNNTNEDSNSEQPATGFRGRRRSRRF